MGGGGGLSQLSIPSAGSKRLLLARVMRGRSRNGASARASNNFMLPCALLPNSVLTFAQARRYDSRTTTFSPEGRLYQVEYAMTAIGHAGICIGVLATDGVLLGVEKKIASKLLEVTTSEKMYKVSAVLAACRQ